MLTRSPLHRQSIEDEPNHHQERGPLLATCLLIPIVVLVGSGDFKATAAPTPVFVRSVVAARTGGGGGSTTPAIGTSSGDLFVVAVSRDGDTINVNVTDSKGNTCQPRPSRYRVRHQSLQIFYVANGAGGASHTFTATPSTNAKVHARRRARGVGDQQHKCSRQDHGGEQRSGRTGGKPPH